MKRIDRRNQIYIACKVLFSVNNRAMVYLMQLITRHCEEGGGVNTGRSGVGSLGSTVARARGVTTLQAILADARRDARRIGTWWTTTTTATATTTTTAKAS